MRRIAAMLLVCLFTSVAAMAAAVGDNCPLLNKTYTARLQQTEVNATVGEEFLLTFALDPPEIPSGFFITVNVNPTELPPGAEPAKPEILTGFPETSITCHAPGLYRFDVIVSLMAKGSCGGLTSVPIYEGEARAVVE